MRNNSFVSGVVTGSIIGATAGIYAASKMTPKQKRRMVKRSRRMLVNMIGNMGLF